jgi:hypothetical protein
VPRPAARSQSTATVSRASNDICANHQKTNGPSGPFLFVVAKYVTAQIDWPLPRILERWEGAAIGSRDFQTGKTL